MKRIAIALAGLLTATLPNLGHTTTVLLESDADRNAGSEVYTFDYATRVDMLSNSIGFQGFTPLDINPLFSAADFAFDGGYNLLLESNADRNANDEVYFVRYDDLDALRSSTISSQTFLPLDINPLFSISGFTYGAGMYSLLLESDADRNANNEVYFLQYASFADMLSNTIASQYFLPLDINPLFSIGGLAYENGAYQLLLESNADRNANNEVYFLEYASLVDLTANAIGPQSFLPLDVNPLFSIHGFEGSGRAYEPPSTSVPEPATLAGMSVALVTLLAMHRRRRRNLCTARRVRMIESAQVL